MARLCLLVVFTTLLSFAHGTHFKLVPIGKTEPCIIMDADFSIKIEAIRNHTVLETANFTSKKPNYISVTGKCAPNPLLKLEFLNGVSWTLFFKKPSDIVFLDRQLQFVPDRIFSKKTAKLNKPLTFSDPRNWKLGSGTESFLCNSEITTTYIPKTNSVENTTFVVTNTIKNFQVQAFDVTNGTYSPSRECSQDAPTTEAPTTTTTFPPPPDNSYYVTDKNVTCIALAGELSLAIRYEKNNSKGEAMGSVSVDIPDSAKASGSCHLSNDTQNLIITFFDHWSVEMIFEKMGAKSDKSSQTDGVDKQNDYRIQSIILTYVIDHTTFPDAVLPKGHVVKVNATGESYKFPEKSSGKEFYRCKSKVDLVLDDNSTLTTSDFKFKAFNDDSNRNFTGSASECAADEGSNDHLYIIIAAAVGGFVFLVIVIVVVKVVCTKRRKVNYESLQ